MILIGLYAMSYRKWFQQQHLIYHVQPMSVIILIGSRFTAFYIVLYLYMLGLNVMKLWLNLAT